MSSAQLIMTAVSCCQTVTGSPRCASWRQERTCFERMLRRQMLLICEDDDVSCHRPLIYHLMLLVINVSHLKNTFRHHWSSSSSLIISRSHVTFSTARFLSNIAAMMRGWGWGRGMGGLNFLPFFSICKIVGAATPRIA